MIRVGILTVSDRGHRGEYRDLSGPVIRELVTGRLAATVAVEAIVPDERPVIATTLVSWADELVLDLVLTTGGTGFASRDVTPEATRAVLDREAPGLAEALRAVSFAATPLAVLSRAVAGIRGRVLIVNLPGSPRAVEECLPPLLAPLAHGVDLLQERAIGHPRPDRPLTPPGVAGA